MNLRLNPTAFQPGLSVQFGEPFTVCLAPEGEYFVHPVPSHLADGKLMLRISRDEDIVDAEYCVYLSDDGGRTWELEPNWPMGDGNGRHLNTSHTVLPDGTSLAVYRHAISTGRKNEYVLPAFISPDNGKTWTQVEPEPFEIPYGQPLDFFLPGRWPYQQRDKPTPLMEALFEEYGNERLPWGLWPMHPLDDTTVLGYFMVATRTQPAPLYSTLCMESKNRGRSWSLRSVPGPFDVSYEEKNRHKKPLQGFCEPSVTRLPNGDYLIVMRIGAWQPLHIARSSDDCRTWTQPRAIPVFGIRPVVIALPDGILALAAGRPDNTLSFSFDDGESWPWTLRLLDQTNPHHPSTRNNALIQVEPGRLLYLYDCGYRRPDPEVDVSHGIVGHFIEVSTTG